MLIYIRWAREFSHKPCLSDSSRTSQQVGSYAFLLKMPGHPLLQNQSELLCGQRAQCGLRVAAGGGGGRGQEAGHHARPRYRGRLVRRPGPLPVRGLQHHRQRTQGGAERAHQAGRHRPAPDHDHIKEGRQILQEPRKLDKLDTRYFIFIIYAKY